MSAQFGGYCRELHSLPGFQALLAKSSIYMNHPISSFLLCIDWFFEGLLTCWSAALSFRLLVFMGVILRGNWAFRPGWRLWIRHFAVVLRSWTGSIQIAVSWYVYDDVLCLERCRRDCCDTLMPLLPQHHESWRVRLWGSDVSHSYIWINKRHKLSAQYYHEDFSISGFRIRYLG